MNNNCVKIANLQKEQTKLVEMQKELTELLCQVNESINELKVEELQLMSNELSSLKRNLTAVPAPATNYDILSSSIAKMLSEDTDEEFASQINNQELKLDAFLPGLRHNKYEEEEEDDDEMEIPQNEF